jgi:hypothetical protein
MGYKFIKTRFHKFADGGMSVAFSRMFNDLNISMSEKLEHKHQGECFSMVET